MPRRRVRALLVDDDRRQVELIERQARSFSAIELRLDWVETYEAGRRALQRPGLDLGLIDYRLGPQTGVELISEVRAAGVSTPMILLTGLRDPAIDLAASEAGAVQFVEKGADGALLERAIRYAVAHHGGAASTRFLAQADRLTQLLLTVGPTAETLEEVVATIYGQLGNVPVALYLADDATLYLETEQGHASAVENLDPGSGRIRPLLEHGRAAALPAGTFDTDVGAAGFDWCAPLLSDELCFGLLACHVPDGGSGEEATDLVGRLRAPLTAALNLQHERGASYRTPYRRPASRRSGTGWEADATEQA